MAIHSKPAELNRRFQPPVMQEGVAICPRCGARLQRDYEALSCIACGYVYEPEGGVHAFLRALSGQFQRAAAVFPLAPALTRGLDPMVGVMALAVSLVVLAALLRGARSGPGRRRLAA